MLSDLETPISRQRRGPVLRAAEAAGIYLLVALALLVELALVALHPEEDAVLVIGVILLTMALAVWLRFILLVPAVVLVWLIPPSVRDAVLGDEPWLWDFAAVLAGQLYLAFATRIIYRTLRLRMLGPREVAILEVEPDDIAVEAESPVEAEEMAAVTAKAPSVIEKLPPPLPCGRVLGPTEARNLLARLGDLRRELDECGAPIRTLLEKSLSLQLQYQRPKTSDGETM
jgi:hypothetical protein